MSLVPGIMYEFWILSGGIWKLSACSRSANFSMNTEMIEVTGPGDGNFRKFKPTVHEFTAQFDNVLSLGVVGFLDASDLLLLQMNKTSIYCRIITTSVLGNVFKKEAYFYIQSYTDTGAFDGVATFSVSFKGTGLLTVGFTPPTPNSGEVYRFPAMGDTYPPTSGSTAWTVPGLGNKNILEFVKDGRGQSDIILTGTPVGNEVLYETVGSDGVFTSAIPYEDATPPYVLYQNL